jgi:cytochrome c peroxidase
MLVRLFALVALVVPLGLDLFVPVPEGNPVTAEKITLGRQLFGDTRLSRDGRISCASCHDPARAFTKPEPVSPGVFGRRGHRNAPTLVNRAWGRAFFWDGRADTLEAQVLMPIEDPNEMDLPLAEASRRVGVPVAEIGYALATYLRSLMSGDSAFDRFSAGERRALTPLEQDGLRLFRGRGNCTVCHVGPNLSDEKFHNTGVAWAPASDGNPVNGRFLDEGRAGISGAPSERGAFKTPTLRDIGRTAPYMHDGSMATLEEVVAFYNRGGRPNPNLDPEIQRLDFTDEGQRALVAFLRRALDGASGSVPAQ